MKQLRIVLACIWLGCGLLVHAAEERVRTTVTRRDGLTKTHKLVFLDNARISLNYQTQDGVNTVRKRWGDVLWGLFFGRMSGTNGSWSGWNFFQVFEQVGGRFHSVILEKVPKTVFALGKDGVFQAYMTFPARKQGDLEIRFKKFSTYRNWLFMRVTAHDFEPRSMRLNVFPGNSNDPPDREHWLATNLRQVKIEEQGATLTAAERYLALYNKYVQSNGGNYLIYNPSQFSEVKVPIARGQGVSVQLIPRKGVNEVVFALGFFAYEEAELVVPKFIGEDADVVAEFMKTINWDLGMPRDEFERSYQVAGTLGVAAESLSSIRQEFEGICRTQDVLQALEILERLNTLKREVIQRGLQEFR